MKSILIATDIDEEILRYLARDASTGPFYLIEDDGSVDDVLAHMASMLHLGDGSCFSVGVADEEVGLPETRCVAFTGNGPRSAANAKWIGAASPEVVLRIFDGLHESIDYHRGHAARMEVELQQALGDFNGLLEQLEHDEPGRSELWLLRRRVEARDIAFAAAVEGANLARKEADDARALLADVAAREQTALVDLAKTMKELDEAREERDQAAEALGDTEALVDLHLPSYADEDGDGPCRSDRIVFAGADAAGRRENDRILEAARSQLREVTAERDRLRRGKRDLCIIFDGPLGGPDSGRFVEVETPEGYSVRVGAWGQRPDGYWSLRLSAADFEVEPDPEPGPLTTDGATAVLAACPAHASELAGVPPPEHFGLGEDGEY